MTNPVVYYIILLLDAKGSVGVPGLGEFAQNRSNAHLDDDRDLIIPPYSTMSFSADSTPKDPGLLGRFIAFKTGISHDRAQYLVTDFSGRIHSTIQKEGKVVVKGLGRLHSDNGKLIFKADPQTENSRYAALDIVSLRELPGYQNRAEPDVPAGAKATVAESAGEQPVGAAVAASAVEFNAEGTESSGAERTDRAPSARELDRERRRRIPLILPVFFLLFVMVAVLAVLQYKSRTAMMHPASVFNRPPVEDSSLTDSSSSESTDNTLNITPGADPEVQTSPDNETEDIAADSANATLSPTEGDSDPGIVDSSALSDDGADDELRSTPGRESTESSSANTDIVNRCYVVVGAFGVASNVERMTDLLKNSGYESVTMSRGELTQVAIPSECNTPEIAGILEAVRMSIEPAAWIFKR